MYQLRCFSRGQSTIEVRFEKNIYETDEKIRINVDLINQASSLTMITIKASLEREFAIKSDS